MARTALTDPVEIQVGGRSVVNADIEQIVEMRDENDRFLRALELLGEWYERGKIILFVSSQEKCDRVFRDLLRAGYPCLSLHGGKEQSDRECTVADFKSDVCNILVATSVAARGLDVPGLRLVINYDTPNHLEDYVHRVGRTGRAGNQGTAVTFISEEEERFAPDLVKAMTDARCAVPADLREMAERYGAKRKKGAGDKKSGGFGGSGFAFSREERDAERRARKAAAEAAGVELEDGAFSDDDDDAGKGAFDDDGEPVFASTGRTGVAAAAAAADKSRAVAAGSKAPADASGTAVDADAAARPPPPPSTAVAIAGAAAGAGGALALGGATTGAARAAAFAAALAHSSVGRGGAAGPLGGCASLRVRAGDKRFPAEGAMERDAQGLVGADLRVHGRGDHDAGPIHPAREAVADRRAQAAPADRGPHRAQREGRQGQDQGDHRAGGGEGGAAGRVREPREIQNLTLRRSGADFPAKRRGATVSKGTSELRLYSTIVPYYELAILITVVNDVASRA